MVILRPTRKLSSLLPSTAAAAATSDTALGDWYVNRLVVDRQPLLILVSARSLLPMLLPARDVRSLPSRLAAVVRDRLQRCGIDVPRGAPTRRRDIPRPENTGRSGGKVASADLLMAGLIGLADRKDPTAGKGEARTIAQIERAAVRRNVSRFPADFMFQLTVEEASSLRSQFVTLNVGRGTHRKYAPYAFTEQGLRRLLDSNAGLARKLEELERKYDGQFRAVFDAIRALLSPPTTPRRAIGFRSSR